MSVGKKIDTLFKQSYNIISQRLEETNILEEKVAKLEAISGFDIETLTKLFLKGYKMRLEDNNMLSICKKCGSNKLFIEIQGSRRGLYCGECGSWQKWITKDELQIAKLRGYKIIEKEK